MSGEAKKEKIANGKPVGRKALLSDFIEKQVSIITNDGRLVIGRLRGFDQVCNVILEKCVERVFAKDCGVQVVSLGLYVIRGDNIAVVGEVDTDKDANVNWADVKVS